jgi:hypothetical protein
MVNTKLRILRSPSIKKHVDAVKNHSTTTASAIRTVGEVDTAAPATRATAVVDTAPTTRTTAIVATTTNQDAFRISIPFLSSRIHL